MYDAEGEGVPVRGNIINLVNNIPHFFASYLVKDKKKIITKVRNYRMKKKLKPFTIIVIIITILLLFPIPFRLKDGGSREYRSIIGIYEVKDWKQMGYTEGAGGTLKTGITIKVFGIKIFDNTKIEVQDVPNTGTPTATPDTIFPITMSAEEMLQKAIEEDFVVMQEFDFLNGEERWKEFNETTGDGNPATITVARYYTLDEEGVSEEYYEENKDEYPKIFFLTLSFDGETYTLTDRPGTMEEAERVSSYPYLVKFEGEPSSPSALFDRYEYYVLVHDKDVTWKELEWGMFSSQMGDYIDHRSVVQKHITEEEKQ